MSFLSFLFLGIFLIDYFVVAQFTRQIDKNLTKNYGKIVQVSVLVRHGERSPFESYPTDPYRDYAWPDGLAQLTLNGQKSSYYLGEWLRTRYADLLNKVRSHTQIRVMSSDRDRCIMTAQSVLAGSYVPNDTQKLDPNLAWRPIPVHTIPTNKDNMLALEAPCLTLNETINKFYNSDKAIDVSYRKYKNVLNYIVKHSGIECNRNGLYDCAWALYDVEDALTVEKNYGLKLPNWTDKVFPEPLAEIMLSFLFKEMPLSTVRRLVAGTFLQSLMTDIMNRITNETPLFHFYIGHDNTLAAILSSLDIFNGRKMPYGTSLIFELREKTNREYFITIQFLNSTIPAEGLKSKEALSTVIEPYLLQVPGCGEACSLVKFLDITHPFIPKDWEEECHNNINIPIPKL